MKTIPRSRRRQGISLIEVIVALSVFLFAMVAIGRLITFGADRAMDVRFKARATELCRSKMNEVIAGVVPLSSQSDTPFDEDEEWHWSLEADQSGSATGLWNVTVTVSRPKEDGTTGVKVSLSRMVLDPSLRGTVSNPLPTPLSSQNSGTSSSTNGSSTGGSSR